MLFLLFVEVVQIAKNEDFCSYSNIYCRRPNLLITDLTLVRNLRNSDKRREPGGKIRLSTHCHNLSDLQVRLLEIEFSRAWRDCNSRSFSAKMFLVSADFSANALSRACPRTFNFASDLMTLDWSSSIWISKFSILPSLRRICFSRFSVFSLSLREFTRYQWVNRRILW